MCLVHLLLFRVAAISGDLRAGRGGGGGPLSAHQGVTSLNLRLPQFRFAWISAGSMLSPSVKISDVSLWIHADLSVWMHAVSFCLDPCCLPLSGSMLTSLSGSVLTFFIWISTVFLCLDECFLPLSGSVLSSSIWISTLSLCLDQCCLPLTR